jgi:hypothetical protein
VGNVQTAQGARTDSGPPRDCEGAQAGLGKDTSSSRSSSTVQNSCAPEPPAHRPARPAAAAAALVSLRGLGKTKTRVRPSVPWPLLSLRGYSLHPSLLALLFSSRSPPPSLLLPLPMSLLYTHSFSPPPPSLLLPLPVSLLYTHSLISSRYPAAVPQPEQQALLPPGALREGGGGGTCASCCSKDSAPLQPNERVRPAVGTCGGGGGG